METITFKTKLKRKEPEFVQRARKYMKREKEKRSRLKNGDLYDMKELEKAIFDDDYFIREAQRYNDHQYLERQKYLETVEGQTKAFENKIM